MNRYVLIVPAAIRAEIETLALPASDECCGLLGGLLHEGVATVDCHFPLVNELQSPVLYSAEPRSLLAGFRALRAANRDLLGIWHTHPASDPVPSRRDVEQWYYDDVMLVILGVRRPQCDWRGWWVSARMFQEGELRVERS